MFSDFQVPLVYCCAKAGGRDWRSGGFIITMGLYEMLYIFFFKIKGLGGGGVIITAGFSPRGRYVLVLFVNGPQPRGGFIIAPGFIIVLLGLNSFQTCFCCTPDIDFGAF